MDEPLISPEEIAEALRKVEYWRDQIAETRARISGAFPDDKRNVPETHSHRWAIIGVWLPQYQPIHPRMADAVSTVVLLKCRICEWPETTLLNGKWTAEQVKANVRGDGDNVERDDSGG